MNQRTAGSSEGDVQCGEGGREARGSAGSDVCGAGSSARGAALLGNGKRWLALLQGAENSSK